MAYLGVDNQKAADSQAMTEVALGLAMAFFAMMILAMLSMSSSAMVNGEERKAGAIAVSLRQKSEPVNDSQPGAESKNGSLTNADDLIIIYYQGRYLNTQLESLDVKSLNDSQNYVLALSPNLSLKTVLAVKSEISAPNLVITELDEAWLSRLAL